MIALIQRVSRASVQVDGKTIGQIDRGLLALVGVQPDDDEAAAQRLLHKLLNYRVFEDEQGRMNLGLQQTGGGLLLVPQFTLAADTRSGLRPGFSTAASPAKGEQLFGYLLQLAEHGYSPVAAGQFGADMAVELVNQGPATFWLET